MLNQSFKADYFERHSMKHVWFKKPTFGNSKIKQHNDVKTIAPFVNIKVAAYSECPDFAGFYNAVYGPFYTVYSELAKYVQFKYVSMA